MKKNENYVKEGGKRGKESKRGTITSYCEKEIVEGGCARVADLDSVSYFVLLSSNIKRKNEKKNCYLVGSFSTVLIRIRFFWVVKPGSASLLRVESGSC